MSKNWCTRLPYLRRSWIYYTGKQHKVSLFRDLFICLSFPCSLLLHHGSHLSIAQVCLHLAHCITFPLEQWLPSFPIPIPVQMECPSLVLTVPQTLAFLSSHVSANLTLLQKWLDRCDNSGLSCRKRVIKPCLSNFCPSAVCIFIILPRTSLWPALHVFILFPLDCTSYV
jgi:hypothetical protein